MRRETIGYTSGNPGVTSSGKLTRGLPHTPGAYVRQPGGVYLRQPGAYLHTFLEHDLYKRLPQPFCRPRYNRHCVRVEMSRGHVKGVAVICTCHFACEEMDVADRSRLSGDRIVTIG